MPDFGVQPSHTFIEGADRFGVSRARELGDDAQAALDRWAPNAEALSRVLAQPPLAPAVALEMYEYVRSRLAATPVEDFRIDFEDGYGFRPDADEDEHATRAARAAARSARAGTLPPFIGIRVKPFSPALRARSERTTGLFVRLLVDEHGGLPARLAVNVAKVTSADQVQAMADALARLEHGTGLAEGSIALEIMLETPAAFMGEDGRSPLPGIARAGGSRLRSACFGPYDFTTAIGIAPFEQRLGHPACDMARQQLLLAYAEAGIWLADGSTSLLPVPPTAGADAHADAAHVRRAWRAHYDDVRRSQMQGFYQGWDVHAAQLVTRWSAVYLFYREGYLQAAPRLKGLLDRARQSTHLGAVFDDPATGEALLAFVRRAHRSGVVSADELARSGISAAELDSRFAEIVAHRSRQEAVT